MRRKYVHIKRNIPLTQKQVKVLSALKGYIAEKQRSPTFNELNKILGFTVKDALVSLRRRGMITWGNRVARSLAILQRPERGSTITIAHDKPERAREDAPPNPATTSIVSLLRTREKQIHNELKKIHQAIAVLEKNDF